MNMNLKKVAFVFAATALLGSVFASHGVVGPDEYDSKTTEFLEKAETRVVSVDTRNKVECVLSPLRNTTVSISLIALSAYYQLSQTAQECFPAVTGGNTTAIAEACLPGASSSVINFALSTFTVLTPLLLKQAWDAYKANGLPIKHFRKSLKIKEKTLKSETSFKDFKGKAIKVLKEFNKDIKVFEFNEYLNFALKTYHEHFAKNGTFLDADFDLALRSYIKNLLKEDSDEK